MNLDPDELRKEIDDTLAELDRLETEVVQLFGELLGPDAAKQVAAYMRAKERDPETDALRPSVRREVAQGPWTALPGIP
jgi:hypothetical protein